MQLLALAEPAAHAFLCSIGERQINIYDDAIVIDRDRNRDWLLLGSGTERQKKASDEDSHAANCKRLCVSTDEVR